MQRRAEEVARGNNRSWKLNDHHNCCREVNLTNIIQSIDINMTIFSHVDKFEVC